jgi:hypothetical protein
VPFHFKARPYGFAVTTYHRHCGNGSCQQSCRVTSSSQL